MLRWLVAVLLVFSACGGDASKPATDQESPYDELVGDLCESLSLATDGDVTGAQRVFEDRVHGPLHDLAADVQEVDRGAAADLLVAKNAVEQRFEATPEQAGVTKDLRSLSEAVGRSVEALGQGSGGCP